jgi:hypothetical protein
MMLGATLTIAATGCYRTTLYDNRSRSMERLRVAVLVVLALSYVGIVAPSLWLCLVAG